MDYTARQRANKRRKPANKRSSKTATRRPRPTLADRKIILFNKPFQVLCQFTDESTKQRQTLADFIDIKDVYAAGRLDYDSEGLLVLTNDGQLQAEITNPKYKKPKTYYVQVDNEITDEAIEQLREGVELKDGKTRPAKVEKVPEPNWLWERTPPIRYRKDIPTSWIKLTITEGKNRQVRRMTAVVGFPTLRLIRYAIGDWTIDDLVSGEFRMINKP